MNGDFIKNLRTAAIALKENHRKSAHCERPRTCGGCHFWSGVIAACEAIENKDSYTMELARKITQRSEEP